MKRSGVFAVAPLVAAAAFLASAAARDPIRFAVIGDSGTGERQQYEVARQMVAARDSFRFDFVLMLGDNLYGGDSPADYKMKFETPYAALLDAGVRFYASLGNHDRPNERFYKPFHMDGKRFYSFRRGNAEFFALDSNYMDPEQLDWVGKQLAGSRAEWKICFFHHPLYSDGKMHGPDKDLRARLEPLLVKNRVNLVLCGHEHAYERLKPQNGVGYIILGNSAKLRSNDFHASTQAQVEFDKDRAFLLVEIDGDELRFRTVSRTGETVDSGALKTAR